MVDGKPRKLGRLQGALHYLGQRERGGMVWLKPKRPVFGGGRHRQQGKRTGRYG